MICGLKCISSPVENVFPTNDFYVPSHKSHAALIHIFSQSILSLLIVVLFFFCFILYCAYSVKIENAKQITTYCHYLSFNTGPLFHNKKVNRDSLYDKAIHKSSRSHSLIPHLNVFISSSSASLSLSLALSVSILTSSF